MMILEKHQLWFAVAILCAVIIGGFILHAYIMAEKDKAAFEQLQRDNKPVHDSSQQQQQQSAQATKESQERDAANQRQFLAALAALSAQHESSMTPAQVDAMIAAHMGQNANAHTSTDSQGNSVTTIDTQALRDYQYKCDTDQLGLKSCKTTVAEITIQRDAAVEDAKKAHASEALFKQELDKLKSQKGMGWRHRIADCAWSVGTNGLTGLVSGPNDQRGRSAAIGAAIGSVPCFLRH